jgi:hypothetical protein
LEEHNISVNMYVVDASWLFSLYWCAGAESVTTNQVHRLASLEQPIWQLVSIQIGRWSLQVPFFMFFRLPMNSKPCGLPQMFWVLYSVLPFGFTKSK